MKSFYDSSNKEVAFKKLVKKKIMTKNFDQITKDIPSLRKINFLNIDCEGHDYSVLNGFNLKIHNPELICIETHDVNNTEALGFKNINNLLNNHNYTLLKRCGPSSIFKKK